MHDNFVLDHIAGVSPWARYVRRRVVQISNYSFPILLSGPSGSGKCLIARAIHAHSHRWQSAFVPVDCATIPQPMRASQLFGHCHDFSEPERSSVLGCLRAADGGTILLKNIESLDDSCQEKLLNVLTDKHVSVDGDSGAAITVNVRVLASTAADLAGEVSAGRFRADLFHRLNILSMTTVPLKDRVEDIRPLVRRFIAKATVENGLPLKRLSPATLAILESHPWPGNVTELQQLIETAVIENDCHILQPEAFPEVLDAAYQASLRGPVRNEATDTLQPVNQLESVPAINPVDGGWSTLEQIEAEHIRATLKEVRFNAEAAAKLLGIDRKTLAEKIRRYQIPIPYRYGNVKTA